MKVSAPICGYARKEVVVNELASKRCVPCRGGVSALKGTDIQRLHEKLENNWNVMNEHHLEKVFRFKDFREALDFTWYIGELAEQQDHHPDIHLAWGEVKVTIWTHKIDGLTESDFIFAAKVDQSH